MIEILSLALLPVVVLVAFVLYKDRKRPEPVGKLFGAFFMGLLSVFVVFMIAPVIGQFVDISSPTIMGQINCAFWGAAIPEEMAKLLMLWIVLRKNRYFDEHFDGIVYAVMVGLGFAAFENLLYLIDEPNWVGIGLARALMAVPAHYAFAVFMGYFYSLAHMSGKYINYVWAFVVSMLLHGIYDMLLMVSGVVPDTLGGLLSFMCIVLCVKMHNVAVERINMHLKIDDKCRMNEAEKSNNIADDDVSV